ncbi:MAG: branched-chain amino acid aminotransferase [Clostridia bacterium]|nr:branched-chain amino acid aminotransferase [Clostridia bacterium]
MALRIELTNNPKAKPDESALGFGKYFTDHMFIMDYTEGIGWHDERIVPFGPLAMSPAAMVLHYGQAIFEGLKAYRRPDGKIQLFRPMENLNRFNRSADRLCIPRIDTEMVFNCLTKLLEIEADWVPHSAGTSLYIRPFAVAMDPVLGVHVANTYHFMIILSPVGNYYAEGLKPVRILVEDEYVRAVRGGMGFAKAAGNYAVSLIADHTAKAHGCAQVLWLDGVERKYIEEVGSMNIFFKINGQLITPALQGSILGGITRKSVLELAGKMGFDAVERQISIDEVLQAHADGTLEEVFGTGTAAVISPVGHLVIGDKEYRIADGEMGPCASAIYDKLTGIQFGKLEDEMDWTVVL